MVLLCHSLFLALQRLQRGMEKRDMRIADAILIER